jgi:meiotically up-regulated gene 157 (Mug157) protein
VLAGAFCAAPPCGAETLSTGGMAGIPIMVAPEALFHTLAADFFPQRDGTIYVQTGDIPAMWLRDSAAQTLPYVRLARDRPRLKVWIRAVIERDARNVAIDPYANAFRVDYRAWERKWEVDSLAYPIVLAWAYDDAFHDRKLFTPALHVALDRTVATFDCESRHASCSHYRIPAGNGPSSRRAAPGIGLIWSAFRPSDDPTRFGYNVPGQMLATTALRDIADLADEGFGDTALAGRARALADTVAIAIERYAVVRDVACGGPVYAYEIDGMGGAVTYDDANLPSLLAAPLTGFLPVRDPIYQRTRACLLTSNNRYFFRGRTASGIGSPHTPAGYVWPLALMSRALTSTDRREVLQQLQFLADSAGPGGRIHESFDPNDPAKFTRAEFGWANAMYAELLFRAAADLPAQLVVAAPALRSRAIAPPPIGVVDAKTARRNHAALLTAFDRAVPAARPFR